MRMLLSLSSKKSRIFSNISLSNLTGERVHNVFFSYARHLVEQGICMEIYSDKNNLCNFEDVITLLSNDTE